MGLIQQVDERLSGILEILKELSASRLRDANRLSALEKALGNRKGDDDDDDSGAVGVPPRQPLRSIPTIFGPGGVAPFPPAPGQPDPPVIKKEDLDKLIVEHREALEEIEEMKQELRALLAGKKKSKR